VIALLRELNDEGLTLILVTHDAGIGESAPRLVRMRDGVVVSDERKDAPASAVGEGSAVR
jgi:ABC-type lipoprotein export system ATPase subunit